MKYTLTVNNEKTDIQFKNIAAAKEYFNMLQSDRDGFDWRVGFLLAMRRNGSDPAKVYGLIDSAGNKLP